jgi:tRNA threonylcarbamoyl adenosine modification protein YeaZ
MNNNIHEYKYILSLDTSTSIGSVALHRGEDLLGYKESLKPRGHTEFINQAIHNLLLENNLEFQNLNVVALINGPGSFTGLRVSGNVARSLSYSLGIPLIVKNSLLVMTELLRKKVKLDVGEILCPVLNAFKNQIFTAFYDQDENKNLVEVLSPRVFDVSEFIDLVEKKSFVDIKSKISFFGEGLLAYKLEFEKLFMNCTFINKSDLVLNPRADILGFLAYFSLQKQAESSIMNWSDYTPLYLKASDPEEKLMKS